ncbi:Ig-like domain-containing protein [Geomonas agri]|uniref:Ig-like domain-containing protein n=1 Tax=Geomonas agri TaxID=2873702 RepID=UPI0021E6158B|nr:Ig-like domain-containing protein [Geomonas agri]
MWRLKGVLLGWIMLLTAACGGGGGGTPAGSPDVTAPSVALTAPANGTTIAGVTAVTADASDDVGVTKVEFYLNGVLQGSDSSAPYSYSWDPSTLARGSYTWTAKAYDAAGNQRQSAAVTVTVPVYATMTTVVNGTGAVGTVSLAGIPVAAPYGVNFVVTMPAGATLSAVSTSGPYAGSGLATVSGANSLILASSPVASGEIMTVTFANVPSGARSADFGITVSAVYDGNGNLIQ